MFALNMLQSWILVIKVGVVNPAVVPTGDCHFSLLNAGGFVSVNVCKSPTINANIEHITNVFINKT